MSTSLSKPVKCLSGKLHSNKCADCKSKLGGTSFKDDQLMFRWFECRKNYQKDFDKDLINRFENTYTVYFVIFRNEDFNRFIFLLRKDFYPDEYMDSWERFNETSLSKNKTLTAKYI